MVEGVQNTSLILVSWFIFGFDRCYSSQTFPARVKVKISTWARTPIFFYLQCCQLHRMVSLTSSLFVAETRASDCVGGVFLWSISVAKSSCMHLFLMECNPFLQAISWQSCEREVRSWNFVVQPAYWSFLLCSADWLFPKYWICGLIPLKDKNGRSPIWSEACSLCDP